MSTRLVDHEKIRKLRLKLKISQEEAGRRASFGTKQAWGAVETGARANVTVQTLYGLSVALDVRMKDLLTESRGKRPRPRNRSISSDGPFVRHALIRRLRLELGLSQKDATAKARFKHTPDWGEIERGDRPSMQLPRLERVARALGVQAGDLLR